MNATPQTPHGAWSMERWRRGEALWGDTPGSTICGLCALPGLVLRASARRPGLWSARCGSCGGEWVLPSGKLAFALVGIGEDLRARGAAGASEYRRNRERDAALALESSQRTWASRRIQQEEGWATVSTRVGDRGALAGSFGCVCCGDGRSLSVRRNVRRCAYGTCQACRARVQTWATPASMGLLGVARWTAGLEVDAWLVHHASGRERFTSWVGIQVGSVSTTNRNSELRDATAAVAE